MAARSFLLEGDLTTGFERLTRDFHFPDRVAPARAAVSEWLAGALRRRLDGFGDFLALGPILLGSWARGELCPKSDIDILFTGPEDRVKDFVGLALRDGLKLRSRTPEDPTDWTVGVEPFDWLALFSARALVDVDARRLAEQRERALAKRSAILRAVRSERESRRRRKDGVANYLEPNVKFGGGGLRDIDQALSLRSMFAERLADADPYPFRLLGEIKEVLLFVRAHLHFLGSGDVLTAGDQGELAGRFGMETSRDLMTYVQSELERASFYSDWIVAMCATGPKARAEARRPFRSLSDVVRRLRESPTLLNQFEVRRTVNDWFRGLSKPQVGRQLHTALVGPESDAYLVSLHRTRLFEAFIPDLVKVRGLVQHDHYHRFTADAHLVQTLREVQRAHDRPRGLGSLSPLTRELTARDWWTLKLTALFHDLAKGRGGHHSIEGAKLVEKYFKEWNYPEPLTRDVVWLVENHLILSTAAFRQNPGAQTTWTRLFERGVEGRRLVLLALFTAVDIRATNPDAWTAWKSKLLADLVVNLQSPRARNLRAHLRQARGDARRERERLEKWLVDLDPVLLEALPPKILIADLLSATGRREPLAPLAVLGRDGRVWVRFHHPHDQTGLFLSFVRRLFGFGLSVQAASVHTLDGIGVYDWFRLRTEKPVRRIGKWLNLPLTSSVVPVPEVKFQSIDVMSVDEDEWVFSFRGRDQRGLLVAAANGLVDENLSLKWARVHTWGQQVDDVFGVRPFGESQEVLSRLRRRFVT